MYIYIFIYIYTSTVARGSRCGAACGGRRKRECRRSASDQTPRRCYVIESSRVATAAILRVEARSKSAA